MYVGENDLYGLGLFNFNTDIFKQMSNSPTIFSEKTPEQIEASRKRIQERKDMIASLPPSSFKVTPSGNIPEMPKSGTLAVKSALELGEKPLEFQMPWDQMVITRDRMWGEIPVWIMPDDINYRIKMFKDAKLKGEVEIIFEGKSLGKIPYIFIRKNPRRITTTGAFGIKIQRQQPTPEENLKAFFEKGQKGMYSGWVDGYFSQSRWIGLSTDTPIIPFHTIRKPDYIGSLYAEMFGERQKKESMSGVVTYFTGFNYFNPDTYMNAIEDLYPEQAWNDIKMYYDIVDNPNKVQILIDQGYEDPTAELGNRIQLNAKWPLNQACKYFWLGTMRHSAVGRLNAFSPADATMIINSLANTPNGDKGAKLLIGEPSVQKVLKAFDDNFGLEANPDTKGSGLYGARVNMLQKVLSGAMSAVKDRHFWCFNYPYWNYIVEGGMPATFVMTSQKEYNRLQEKKAKRAGIQKIIPQILSLAILAIPGVGTAGIVFSTAFTSALEYSNYRTVQSQVKVQERQSKEIERETARVAEEVQEEIKQIEIKQADTAKEQTKSTLKKGLTIAGIIGAGFLAVTQIMDN